MMTAMLMQYRRREDPAMGLPEPKVQRRCRRVETVMVSLSAGSDCPGGSIQLAGRSSAHQEHDARSDQSAEQPDDPERSVQIARESRTVTHWRAGPPVGEEQGDNRPSRENHDGEGNPNAQLHN
jgi:hypothetical protein